jgi:hypothetical protein
MSVVNLADHAPKEVPFNAEKEGARFIKENLEALTPIIASVDEHGQEPLSNIDGLVNAFTKIPAVVDVIHEKITKILEAEYYTSKLTGFNKGPGRGEFSEMAIELVEPNSLRVSRKFKNANGVTLIIASCVVSFSKSELEIDYSVPHPSIVPVINKTNIKSLCKGDVHPTLIESDLLAIYKTALAAVTATIQKTSVGPTFSGINVKFETYPRPNEISLIDITYLVNTSEYDITL